MDFWINKEDPETAIMRFIKAAATIQPSKQLTIQIDTSAGNNHYRSSGNNHAEVDAIINSKDLKTVIEWLKSKPHAQLISIDAHAPRPPSNTIINARFQRDTHYDRIFISARDQNIRPADMAPILDAFMAAYDVIPAKDVLTTTADEKATLQEKLTAQLIQRFADSTASLHHAISTEAHNLLQQVTATAQELRQQTERERLALREAHEADAARLKQEHEALEAKLKQDREAFEEEKKKWNDQNSTHVRRDLLEKIRGQLEARGKTFQLSKDTYEKANPIRLVYIFLVVASAGAATAFGYKVVTDQSLALNHLIPFTSSLIALMSTAIYFIRWQNNWLTRHADLETKNQLLDYDMLRASWFAEMLFEYRKHEGQPLPESVIQVMTRNLFDSGLHQTPATHPAEDMGAFIQRINRLRLGSNEVELEVKPGDKKP